MDLNKIRWNLSQTAYPECALNALSVIRGNLNKYSEIDLNYLANEFIFYKEYQKEQSKWIKKATSFQELQCIDLLTNYFESETEPLLRFKIFELLFNDIYLNKDLMPILISYAISLNFKNTLDCVSKWIQLNIGNELIQNLFKYVAIDHLCLINDNKSLENLCHVSPLFASLLLTIILDNYIQIDPDKHKSNTILIKNLIKLMPIWLKACPSLPILAYKQNLTHSSAYLLNPFPGLLYLTTIYPMQSGAMISEEDTENVQLIHLACLKLVQELAYQISDSRKQSENVNILNLQNLEYIKDCFDFIYKHNLNLNESIKNDCMDRLAQVLHLAINKSLLSVDKLHVKKLFEVYAQPDSLMSILF